MKRIIDDDRSKNAFGLMMSLNMLIETPGGFRLHGRRLPGLDERSRVPRIASGAPGRARLDGRRHQIGPLFLSLHNLIFRVQSK